MKYAGIIRFALVVGLALSLPRLEAALRAAPVTAQECDQEQCFPWVCNPDNGACQPCDEVPDPNCPPNTYCNTDTGDCTLIGR